MAKGKGILLNTNYDIAIKVVKDAEGLIKSGLVIGDSAYQQQTLLLLANKGEIKEKPMVGVGIGDFLLDDSSSDAISQEINNQFAQDGMRVYDIKINEGQLNVDARYEDGDSFR